MVTLDYFEVLPSHASDSHSPASHKLLFEHGSFHLVSWGKKILGTAAGFSPGTFHTPVVILTQLLHTYTMTTVDAI